MTISLSSPNSSTASIQKNGGDVITFDANNNATFAGNVVTTGTVVSGSAMGMRNRIINGDMRIDQRNNGSAVSAGFISDRWFVENGSDSVFSCQRTTDVPSGSGFVNSLKVTATTADASIGSTQYAVITHFIEGYNIADLDWGTSNAKTITASFWVKASNAGQYSFTCYNLGATRINPQAFTINTANTWEYKTIIITGETTGTWNITNNRGIVVNFYMSLGSNYLDVSGWNSSSKYGVTGQANAFGTTNNIFAITGVQLEVGSVATPFERRQYGQELQLCQRYFQVIISGTGYFSNASAQTSTNAWGVYTLGTSMRANPTGYVVSGTNYYRFIAHDLDDYVDVVYVNGQSPNVVSIGNSTQISNTQGRPGVYTATNAASFVAAQAELS